MPILISMLLLLACSSIMCLFGFFVGRCARKLPIIDNNLPWIMHRGHIQQITCDNQTEPRVRRWTQSGIDYQQRYPVAQILQGLARFRPVQLRAVQNDDGRSDATGDHPGHIFDSFQTQSFDAGLEQFGSHGPAQIPFAGNDEDDRHLSPQHARLFLRREWSRSGGACQGSPGFSI